MNDRKPIFDAVKRLRGGKSFTQTEVDLLNAAIDEAEGVAGAHGLANAGAFFASARAHLHDFTQSQVDGFNFLLDAFAAADWPLTWAAYGLATAWHETAGTMEPVREAYWLSEDWRKRNLRYWPWYGRGYVQLTWEPNYRKADRELALGGALIASPDIALRPDIAARVMVHGMEEGWFTGKKLGDYLPGGGYVAPRQIINGTDRAADIAAEAIVFEDALKAGGWQ